MVAAASFTFDGFDIHLLTPERWADFEELFGSNGACGGCWCMWFKLKRSEFERSKGEANRQAMKALVDSGATPGLLAYDDRQPVGWCAVAPREHYPSLQRSRILKPVDDRPVWSIVCFFVKAGHRRRGVSRALLQAAVASVRERGGTLVEAYPVDSAQPKVPSLSAYTGLARWFTEAGFVECARRSEKRPIMRFGLE